MAKKELDLDAALDDIGVKRCLVTKLSYINLRKCRPGEVINYVGKIGSNLIDLTNVSEEEEKRLIVQYTPR